VKCSFRRDKIEILGRPEGIGIADCDVLARRFLARR
jgi:hypothetical protein